MYHSYLVKNFFENLLIFLTINFILEFVFGNHKNLIIFKYIFMYKKSIIFITYLD